MDIVRMCVQKRSSMPKCSPSTNLPIIRNGMTVQLSVATINRQTWQLIRRVHQHAGKKMKVTNLQVVNWSEIAKGRQSRCEPARSPSRKKIGF
jgi:hypothetical protein